MKKEFLMLIFLCGIQLRAQHVLFSGNDYTSGFLSEEGYVYTCGQNFYGQLGVGASPSVSTPVRVKGLGGVGFLPPCKQISLEGFASCLALSSTGDSVFAWGKNDNGELGIGNTINQNLPRLVKGVGGVGILSDVKQICASGYNSYALLENGRVLSWGQNIYGELGCNTNLITQSTSPVYVLKSNGDTLENVKRISAGGSFCMAILCDGTAWIWGRNHRGQLAQNSNVNSFGAIQVKKSNSTFLQNITFIEAGDNYAYAISNDTLFSWGSNTEGQLGTGDINNRWLPVYVRASVGVALLNVKEVSAGQGHVVALMQDGTLKAWGNNALGQIGSNDQVTVKVQYPVSVVDESGVGVLSNINYITVGDRFSIARNGSGEIFSWGENATGQLALGDFVNRFFPVKTTMPFNPTTLQLPIGGSVVGPQNVCYGFNQTQLHAINFSWPITSWNFSYDGFVSDSIVSSTNSSQLLLNVSKNTWVTITSQECNVSLQSTVKVVNVDPFTIPGNVFSKTQVVEKGRNQDSLHLIDYLGDVNFWQYSSDNFVLDSTTVATSKTTFGYSNLDSTRYFRAAVKSGTCPLKYSVSIKIHVIKEDVVKIYNGFTPNGDEYNDEWIIDSLEYFLENTVEVFDRNGSLVYKEFGYNNKDKVWKGEDQQRNIPLPDGTYFYRVSPGSIYKSRTGYVVISR